MKRVNWFSSLILAIGLSAAGVSNAAQYVLLTPARAYINNNNGPYLQIVPVEAMVNIAGCSSSDSYILHDSATVNGGLAIALTAMTTGHKIQVYLLDTCDATTGRPQISAIGML